MSDDSPLGSPGGIVTSDNLCNRQGVGTSKDEDFKRRAIPTSRKIEGEITPDPL
ncbi:MAG: hypothetical protein HGB26_07445 [Desulfobulbaceae bacterium]|nr:hypothetical protein [Desulfobulbaceae bacterium]